MSGEHIVLPGSTRPAKKAKRIRKADPDSRLEVTISLRGPKLPDANNMPAASMSHQEFESKYSARAEDAEKVASVLQKYQLKVEEISLPARSMRVSGTVAGMEAAFQPNLGIYRSKEQGDYRGREGKIKIPTELGGIVTGVFGLDERRVVRQRSAKRATARRSGKRAAPRKSRTAPTKAAATKIKMAPLTPADIEKLYNFPPGEGQGQQIGIAEFDGGFFPDDLQAYCAKEGRAVPSVTVVPVGLTPLTFAEMQQLPKPDFKDQVEASGEVNMDIQIVAGLCPEAEIFVYFAPFTQKGWVDLLNKVISGSPAKPVTLSVSWGLAEDSGDWSEDARTQISARIQAAAMLGITICISSGDDGSGDEQTDGRAHIDFPSSAAFTLSVGGTMLTGTAAKPVEETWWQSPGRRTPKGTGSTGGGVSVFFPRPSWQSVSVKSLNKGSIDGRVIPDIAALAGPPLHDLILLGRSAPNGGTSASTPVWAALIARINASLPAAKRQRFLTPLLYQNGAAGQPRGVVGCRDITIGQNASHPDPGTGYAAGVGFDAVTGWGVPDGVALLSAL
jgi:kumamolisin